MACCNCITDIPIRCSNIAGSSSRIGTNFDITLNLNLGGFLSGSYIWSIRNTLGYTMDLISPPHDSIFSPCSPRALTQFESLLNDPGDFNVNNGIAWTCNIAPPFQYCTNLGSSVVIYSLTFGYGISNGCLNVSVSISATCKSYVVGSTYYYPESSFFVFYSNTLPSFSDFNELTLYCTSDSGFNVVGGNVIPVPTISGQKLYNDYISLTDTITITKT